MKKVLQWSGILLGGLLLLVLLFVAYVNFSPIKKHEVQAPELTVTPTTAKVEAGAKFAQMHCIMCHASDDGKLGGKLIEESALGTAYASNITQHPEYGIAHYTDGQLAYLLRTGIKANGYLVYPAMTKFPHLTDEDIENLIAFLRSDHPLVQASDHQIPTTEYTFLGKALMRMGVFAPLTYPEKRIEKPAISDELALGEYLAVAKYECFACHSKSFETLNLMQPEQSEGFFGGGNPLKSQDGSIVLSSNLTMDEATGIGTWTKEQFIKAVRSGVTPDNQMLRSPMIPYALLTEKEVGAIWTYLQSIPKIKNEEQM